MGFLEIFFITVLICKYSVIGEDSDISGVEVKPRIVCGKPAKIEDFPYQAALVIPSKDNRLFCGASIISSEYVLTAAHCIHKGKSESSVLVSFGSIFHNRKNEVRGVKRFILHPEYTSTHENDIGLIQLESSIDAWSNTVRPVKLPKADATNPKLGTMARFAGWGLTESWKLSETLLTGNTKIVACGDLFGWVIAGNDRLVCGGETEASCFSGDSGGPLVIDGVQYGVVSQRITHFGSGVDEEIVYNAYTSVVACRQFIIDNVGEENLTFD